MVDITPNIVGVSLLAIAVAHLKKMVADTALSLASQLPQGLRVFAHGGHHIKYCRSEPARDSVGTFKGDGD
ncbi:hypothetical protein PS898_00152 [Pseudomonas fluorescens]|nr:hypothetical protein PS898_00152 [Pseudomonas fluorescens]